MDREQLNEIRLALARVAMGETSLRLELEGDEEAVELCTGINAALDRLTHGELASLQEREERFHAVQQATRIGSWHWDLVANEVSLSDELIALLDLPEQQNTYALEQLCRVVMPSGDMPDPSEVTPWTSKRTWHYVRPDGELLWMEFPPPVVTRRDEDGRPLAATGIAQDVTERKLASDLQRTERDLASWLCVCPDLDSAIHRVLDGLVAITGIEAAGWYAVEPGGLRLIDTRGLPQGFIEAISTYTPDSPQATMARRSTPTFLERDHLIAALPMSWAEGLHSLAILPLYCGDELVGVLNAASRSQSSFAEPTREALASIATQAGAVVGRLQDQRALRESEQRLASTLASMSDLVFVLDRDGRFVDYHAPRGAGALYAPPERFLGRRFPKVLPQPVAQALNQAIGAARRTGTPVTFDYPMLIGGQVRWFSGRVSAREDSSGAFDGSVAVVREVTDQKRAETELVRLKTAVEQSIDGIAVIDLDGQLQFANRAWAEMHGWTLEDLDGVELRDFFSESCWEATAVPFSATVIRQGSAEAEIDRVRRDGTTFPSWTSTTLMRNESGDPTGFVSIARDITESKAAEAELMEATLSAEALAADLKLAMWTAHEMREEAEEANRAKSEFLAMMSHEIRTPMNGVIGMTGLLLDTELTEEQHEFAVTVRSSADALLSIINDILDFSKIEAGRMELEELGFDLRVTLDEVSDLLAMRALDKGLEFVCLVDPEVPTWLVGDPGRIRQVIVNLVGNAIKFTASGEVAVLVDLVQTAGQGALVRFAIRDTGIGIPPDKAANLFEPFTQADSSTTRRFGGTGLGLSISKQLAELMGGEIGARRNEDVGSTFWFTAWLGLQEEAPVPTPSAAIHDLRVLCVDDNATNRLLVETLLRSWSCRPGQAPSGEAGLAELHAAAQAGDPYQIAIIDMQMPGMDGEELGRRIKADPAVAATELVLMTSMGRRGDATRLEALDFAAYLSKPVKHEALHTCLARVHARSVLPASRRREGDRLITRHRLAEEERRSARILLAEDNVVNQKVAQKILEKMGYRAEVVANGAEAVHALSSAPYDLVLMDCQMPVMDGYEATRRIRDGEGVRDPSVPIVAMTANAMQGDRERCIDAGMDDYVSKPVRPKALGEVLDRWLGAAARAVSAVRT